MALASSSGTSSQKHFAGQPEQDSYSGVIEPAKLHQPASAPNCSTPPLRSSLPHHPPPSQTPQKAPRDEEGKGSSSRLSREPSDGASLTENFSLHKTRLKAKKQAGAHGISLDSNPGEGDGKSEGEGEIEGESDGNGVAVEKSNNNNATRRDVKGKGVSALNKRPSRQKPPKILCCQPTVERQRFAQQRWGLKGLSRI
jgi:hypothetical protein